MVATGTGRAPGQTFRGIPSEFLAAKLRGRRTTLYEGARLRELARAESVEELAWRLFPREDIRDRAALERRLLNACVADLSSFLPYVDGAYYNLFLRLLDRYVVENLKVLLRLWSGGERPEEPSPYLIELPASLSLPVEELLRAAGPEEFVGRLPRPFLCEAAAEAMPLYVQTGRRAYLEMALDRGYWLGVWDALSRLPAEDAQGCQAAIRCEFDAMQLLATMRAAGAYGLDWGGWKPFLVRGPGRITTETLRRVHAAPEVESVLDEVRWLRQVVGRVGAPEERLDRGGLEEALWRESVRLANRQYYGSFSGPVVLVCYYYLKRSEMRRLFSLTQMLRYGTAPEEMIERLGV